ncbi:MAG TPA: type IV pilus secretin PilQ [Burkholderiales bacterium]|nr:type IV pilus secretin PilQ [Burkholderiales bacterium]
MKISVPSMTSYWRTVFLMVLLGFGVNSTYAQNSIESVNVSPQSGGKVIIRVGLKEALTTAPAGFTVNNPPRLAFDFANTGNALGRNVENISDGDVRRINIVQAGDRTRMVMELTRALNYETQLDGKTLLITLQGGTSTTTADSTPARFAEASPTAQKHSLRNVDFRRGNAGEGRVVIDLSDSQIGIDIRKQGRSIVVDFQNAMLPGNLAKRYDVMDFGTPVQTVEATAQGGGARVVITPTGNWEHSAYQADNRFIIEVKRVIEDPNRLVRQGFVGEKLSLNFQNVEVRSVLQVLADFTGLNIITSDSVSGNLTLRLKDVPWDQALDIIMRSKGLDMRKEGNVVWIAPRDELATREKLALEARSQISDLEPLQTESIQLNYQQAAPVQALLNGAGTVGGAGGAQRILSKRGSSAIDLRSNQLFVQDTPSRLEDVRRMIRAIDIPVRQVMIESRIVEASDTFSRNLGVKLGFNQDFRTVPGNTVQFGGNLTNTGQLNGVVAGTPTLDPGGLQVNLPAQGIGGAATGVFSTLIFNQSRSRLLALELSALQADGKGKIISSPRVITANQGEATIEQGTEIAYQQASSSGATTVAFKKATLALKVKPQITPDDNVIMKLNINKDSIGTITAGGIPTIDTKQVTTEVLVENGGTLVIGGIYTQTENSNTTKIPVLGDLPYVGFLFKQNQKNDNRNELLIFITPKILKDNLNLRQ